MPYRKTQCILSKRTMIICVCTKIQDCFLKEHSNKEFLAVRKICLYDYMYQECFAFFSIPIFSPHEHHSFSRIWSIIQQLPK